MKKTALTIALALAATGLTFAAGQEKPAANGTAQTATKAKKHKKVKKGAKTTPAKK